MTLDPVHPVLRYVRTIRAEPPTDHELLKRFSASRDQTAFEAIVNRHGPMVLGVCRRLLDHHDAEDAFQATFLVLARKAASLGHRDVVAGWLHGVAYRTALHARAARVKRRIFEQRVATMHIAEPDDYVDWAELKPLLDEVVQTLPLKYRQPFVLCCLQGKTYDEAALQLGCPKGTIATRLARARQRLQRALHARGISAGSAGIAIVVAEHASAAVPAALTLATVQVAVQTMAGTGAAALLAEGVVRQMLVAKLKVLSCVAAAVALIGAGIVVASRGSSVQGRSEVDQAAQLAMAPNNEKPPAANNPPRSFLKKYRSGAQELDAGFVPQKTEIVLGESITATFTLKNLSAKQFDYWFGGDYRGTGRHNRFKILAVDAAGNTLQDPKAGPNGFVPEMGGIVQIRSVKPSETESKPIDLTQFRTFERAGVYSIKCQFPVRVGSTTPHKDELAFTVETSFELKILPRSASNLARVQRELIVRALKEKGAELNATIGILCSFAGELAVQDLLKLASTGDTEHRAAAVRGLGRFSIDPAVIAALKALDDPDESVRLAAVDALGSMKTDAAVKELTRRWSNEEPAIASGMLVALGRTQRIEVLPELQSALRRPDKKLQKAAVAGLVAHSGEQAIAILKSFVGDKDLDRREAVVTALVESLRQPLELEWVLPLIEAGRHYPKGRNPNEAMRLLRIYGGDKAGPELIRLLDFNDPAATLSFWITYHLSGVSKAPQVNWHHDPNRSLTEKELAENRASLARLRQWLADYDNGLIKSKDNRM